MHHTISQSKTKKCFVIGKCQCSTRKSVLLKFYQGSVSLLNVNDVEVNIGPPSFFHPRIVQKVFHRVVIRILKIGQRSYSHKKVLMNDSIDVDFQNDYFRMKRREEGTTWETFTKVYKKRGWPSQIWKPNSYIGQQEYLYISSCGIKPESFLFIMLYLLGMLKFNVKLSNLRFLESIFVFIFYIKLA